MQFNFILQQTFASFYADGNQYIVKQLQEFTNQTSENFIYLYGQSGSGKTHLSQAVCQLAADKTFYYCFSNALPSISLLDNIENYDLVCLDNINKISANHDWEYALFKCFNCCSDNGKKLLVTADTAPKFIALELPDIKTRMSCGLALHINQLSADQQLQALMFKARVLGFEIPHNVGQFLLVHYNRDAQLLWQLLDKIDYATLAQQRKLTIPFLKQIF